jgi:hypothetical protein
MIYNQLQMLMRNSKEIHEISHFGKQLNLAIHHGQHRGGRADLAGTWNVLQWHMLI